MHRVRGQEPQLQLSRRRAPRALEQRQGQEPTAKRRLPESKRLDPVSQATTWELRLPNLEAPNLLTVRGL